jgi:hypothetical protein
LLQFQDNCFAQAAKLIVTRVESASSLVMLERASANTGVPVYFQGRVLDPAQAGLAISAEFPSAAR